MRERGREGEGEGVLNVPVLLWKNRAAKVVTGWKRVDYKEHRKTDRSKHASLLGRPVLVIFTTTSTQLSPHTAPVDHHPLPHFFPKAAGLQTVRVQSDSDCVLWLTGSNA